MIDESMDTAQMRKPAQPWEFRSKPAWQRLLIMLGGVMVNVVFAFLIYIMVLYTWGETYLPAENVKYGVVCDPLFEKMGMQTGDIVVSLDSVKVERFSDILADMTLDHSQTVQVEREGKLISLDIPETFTADLLALSSKNNRVRLLVPRQLMDSTYVAEFADYSAAYDAGIRKGDKILAVNGRTFRFYDEFTDMLAANADSRVETKVLRGKDTLQFAFDLGNDGKFGIYFGSTERLELAFRKYSFGEAIPAGIAKGAQTISSYLKQLKLIFSPRVEAYKSVGGVMMMGSIFPGVWDWQIFWELTAFISIMLAVVNILPIPALDGGHVLFLLYEVITRRKPGEKFMEYAQITGMMILLGLFILANVNDIVRFFG
jgi:RIP metalloprotease rseP